MKLARLLRRRAADDRGSIILWVAIGLPVLLASFSIAIDVGGWFAHHRSLQNEVDAAALAGGALYADCWSAPDHATAALAMDHQAQSYTSLGYNGTSWNGRYGARDGSSEQFSYNSNSYPNTPGTISDSVSPDPCASPYDFDVKGSVTNLPFLFGKLLPGAIAPSHIDAHARVSLRSEQSAAGELPLAVPNVIGGSPLQLTCPSGPSSCTPVDLRQTGGSTTAAVECDANGGAGFRNQIINGCVTPYQVNPSGVCPDPSPPAGPADCVANKTGSTTGPTSQGLNARLDPSGNSCSAYNWPGYPPNDPRLVQLLITTPAVLNVNGHGTYPVLGFAEFYIAGWDGADNSCAGVNLAFPFSGSPGNGDIWGYFVKYVGTSGTAGSNPCNAASVNPCIPVLSR